MSVHSSQSLCSGVESRKSPFRGRWAIFFGTFALICFGRLAPAARSDAKEIDRLLAAVNGKVITGGDVKVAQAISSVIHLGKAGESPSIKDEVNRLIDLELVRQDLANFPTTPVEQSSIDEELQKLRQAYAEIGGLDYLLKLLGLQESELRSFIALQVSIQRFIDVRFRPFVSVSDEEIRRYYDEALKPSLVKAGVPIPPPEEVSSKIKQILTEEKVNNALDTWIRENRQHARIEFYDDEARGLGQSSAPK